MIIVFQSNYTIPGRVLFLKTGFTARLSLTSGKLEQKLNNSYEHLLNMGNLA